MDGNKDNQQAFIFGFAMHFCQSIFALGCFLPWTPWFRQSDSKTLCRSNSENAEKLLWSGPPELSLIPYHTHSLLFLPKCSQHLSGLYVFHKFLSLHLPVVGILFSSSLIGNIFAAFPQGKTTRNIFTSSICFLPLRMEIGIDGAEREKVGEISCFLYIQVQKIKN